MAFFTARSSPQLNFPANEVKSPLQIILQCVCSNCVLSIKNKPHIILACGPDPEIKVGQ